MSNVVPGAVQLEFVLRVTNCHGKYLGICPKYIWLDGDKGRQKVIDGFLFLHFIKPSRDNKYWIGLFQKRYIYKLRDSMR